MRNRDSILHLYIISDGIANVPLDKPLLPLTRRKYNSETHADAFDVARLLVKERINVLIEDNLTAQDSIPLLAIDAQLDLGDIDMNLLQGLEKMKPYGEGNSQPLFVTRNLFKKRSPKKIHSGFSIWLSDGSKVLEGIVYDKDLLEILD